MTQQESIANQLLKYFMERDFIYRHYRHGSSNKDEDEIAIDHGLSFLIIYDGEIDLMELAEFILKEMK